MNTSRFQMNSTGNSLGNICRSANAYLEHIGCVYRCKVCDEMVLSHQLDRHQIQQHPDQPLDVHIYELLDAYRISSHLQNAVKWFATAAMKSQLLVDELQYKCNACDQQVIDSEWNRHHSTYHLDIPLDMNIFERVDVNTKINEEVIPPSDRGENEQINVQKYICGGCKQNVWDQELDHHHSKYHPDIPLDVNIFEIADAV